MRRSPCTIAASFRETGKAEKRLKLGLARAWWRSRYAEHRVLDRRYYLYFDEFKTMTFWLTCVEKIVAVSECIS